MPKLLTSLAVLTVFGAACNVGATNSVAPADSIKAAAASATAKLESYRAKAIASLDGYNKHDANVICKDYAPDVVEYGDGRSTPTKGLDSNRKKLSEELASFPDYKGENFTTLAEGNKVVVFGDWSATFLKPMGKIKPTGKTWKVKDAVLFTFNDQGQIISRSYIQSDETVLAQLGLKPGNP